MRHDPDELREAKTQERLDQARATNFEAHSRFSVHVSAGDEDDEDRKTSAPAKLKARKNSLAGLTKEERLAKRKASMTAGDSWEDLHGTKDRPGKEVSAARARQLSNLAAAHGDEDPHVAAAVDWSSPANGAAPSSEAAGPSSDSKDDAPPPPPPPPPDDDRMTTVPVQRRNLQTLLASRKDDNEETKFRV